MKHVLPLSCSCSNCDWNLCTTKSKINKDILVCCCGEKNRSDQFVYTCTTCSKKASKLIKQPDICYQPHEVEKVEKKKEKCVPSKESKKTLKDNIDNKQLRKRSQKHVNIDSKCVTKQCTAIIRTINRDKNTSVQNEQSVYGTKSETKDKKNDLYSKIEEIYKICCCELCGCPPSPPSQEISSRDESSGNLDGEIKHNCLCFESSKDNSQKNKVDVSGCKCPTNPVEPIEPIEPGILKTSLCREIDKKANSAVLLHTSPQSCVRTLDKKENDINSVKHGTTGLTSPNPSMGGSFCVKCSNIILTSARPENKIKEIETTTCLVSSKPSCDRLNSSCHKKQEKEVQIILPLNDKENSSHFELSKEKNNQDQECPCHYKDLNTELKSEGSAFPICDCPTFDKLPQVCYCTDIISEDGFPICAPQLDDKENKECPCISDEMSVADSHESIVTTVEECKCNSCDCMKCPNARKKTKYKCEISKTNPTKQRKSKTQTTKFDIHSAMLYNNFPLKRNSNQNSNADKVSPVFYSYKNNRKCRICDNSVCKNNVHEYENILSEIDRCGCSPCECKYCNKNDDSGIYKACKCAKCDCISCSNLVYNNPELGNNNNDTIIRKQNKISQGKKVKSDNGDILYENLILLKKGEIFTNFKTDKEKLVSDQLRFGLNKDLSLPYLVIGKTFQVINTGDNLNQTLVVNNPIKRKSKESIKLHKNSKKGNQNSKECLNSTIPSNSGFITKSLIMLQSEGPDSKITNGQETVRSIKIYMNLKNICDNADEYIKHLKGLLEKSKKDNENFTRIIDIIKSIHNTSQADNPIKIVARKS